MMYSFCFIFYSSQIGMNRNLSIGNALAPDHLTASFQLIHVQPTSFMFCCPVLYVLINIYINIYKMKFCYLYTCDIYVFHMQTKTISLHSIWTKMLDIQNLILHSTLLCMSPANVHMTVSWGTGFVLVALVESGTKPIRLRKGFCFLSN